METKWKQEEEDLLENFIVYVCVCVNIPAGSAENINKINERL